MIKNIILTTFILVLILQANSFGADWISKTNWQLLYVDSQEIVGENGRATNAFDNNPATIWHTEWFYTNPRHPHEIQIDLGQMYNIEGFRYIPRQDGGINGRIGQFEIYVSEDGSNWGTAVAAGTFANSASAQDIMWDARPGRYIRLRALSEVNGNPWTSLSEIGVYGELTTGNLPPNGTITNPTGNLTITAGSTVTFMGTGTDPDGDLPLTYHWNFGGGSGVQDSTLQNPGPVRFNNTGTFTVTFTVTDSLGNTDPTPSTVVITVESPVSIHPLIPKAGWSLLYVDSQELVGENGRATNAFDGNTATIWHTQWYTASPRPPHEIQIDLGQQYSIEGFIYTPRQDGSPNGRIASYEFYLSNDGVNWSSPLATGIFANNASPKQILFNPELGRYVRLRAITEVNSNPWTSMAELDVLGTLPMGRIPPNGIIDTPTGNIVINQGDWVTFTGSGYDSDEDYPLSYLWNFGSNSGIPDSSLEDPGVVQFNNPGVYTVTLTVTDALGNIDPSPATCVVTVLSPTVEVRPDWTNVTSSPFPLYDPSGVVNPVLTAQNVTDANATYVADPFLFHENGTWYMFFEAYTSDRGGVIALAKSTDGRNWTYDRVVLSEYFHLSYPLVIKANGRYYMIPETNEIGEVRIYEARNFPYDWQFVATIAQGRPFVDPSIFYYNNMWWMFVGDTSNRNCYLYYSNNLLSGWIEHPMSPIVFDDSSRARPGGRSFVYNGNTIIRLAQKCNVEYGEQVRAFRVTTLTPTQYSEYEIPESPVVTRAGGDVWNATGMHHVDPWWTDSEWIASVDGYRGATWYIGIRTSTPQENPPEPPQPPQPPSDFNPIPKGGWSLRYVDSQELVGEDGRATNAFDNNPATFWHTQWYTSNPRHPHEIQIDLGQTYTIGGFRYLPRQDGSMNGRIGQYEFYISQDGINWGSAVATGSLLNTAQEQEVNWDPVQGRYVRLRALTEVNGNPWTSLAEITVLGQ